MNPIAWKIKTKYLANIKPAANFDLLRQSTLVELVYSITMQYGWGDLEIPGQGLVSLQIPGVEAAGKLHREDTYEPSFIDRVAS